MRKIHLLAALPLACLFAGQAFAQACTKPLTPKSQIQMESADGGPAAIPVKINGTDQKLTLATAGTTTQISADTAKALNLDIKRADGVLLVDDRGNQSRDEVTIADFAMPGLHGTNLKWPVSIGGGRGGGGRGGSAGLFSLNYMLAYDIDVDFGSDKLTFFLQDHCPGAVMYWKAPGAAGGGPIAIDNGRVIVPVTLNGKSINAVIDTAASTSTVRAAVATRLLGVELGGAKAPAKAGGFGGQAYGWTVDTLALQGLKLENVAITVQPDINSEAGDGAQKQRARASGIQFEMDHPEVTLGMDVLRKLHLYFAFAEKKLYATETVSTLAAAPAATPKAP